MKNEKREAVILVAGRVVGRVLTSFKNGQMVCFGRELAEGGNLIQLGLGKISRAHQHLKTSHEQDDLFVNDGGGPVEGLK